MTKAEECVKGRHGVELSVANKLLTDSRKGKVPLLSEDGRLMSLVSRPDLKKNANFPLATKDKNKNLMVAAFVGTRPADKDRVRALVSAGVDAIVVDSSQGDSMYQREMLAW